MSSLNSDTALTLHCAASYLKQKLARFSAQQHSFKHPHKCRCSNLTPTQVYCNPVRLSIEDCACKLVILQYHYIFGFPFLFSYSKADKVETAYNELSHILNSRNIPLKGH
uniref:Uncharacterized protein n=1 Tax=Rhipicephalus zambeziensis TaxID=60191 RepID=A0A224YF40_9ACAR